MRRPVNGGGPGVGGDDSFCVKDDMGFYYWLF